MAFVVAALRTPETCCLVKELLESEGHTSAIFSAGAAAVAEAVAGAPDVLIVQAQLADMSIPQIRDAMRTQPSTAIIPIVVCDPEDVPALRRAVGAALTLEAPVRTGDPAMNVLLVEDDASIAEPLIDGLARYGFVVDWAATGTAALTAPPAAMVLLDLGLPDIDGLEVCRRLRRAGDVPVLMLTARGDECDRVVGLELGADDYLAKPFSLRELVARMRAVSRRTGRAA
jgi:DNA-binding response OmpR family regulator